MVAEAADVSPAAVSRAFQPNSAISPEKRARILSIARGMGYQTPSARSVARMMTGTVTLVAGDLSNPFYPVAAEALAQAFVATGRRLVLHAVPSGHSIDSVMQQVLDFRSDAAIITSATLSSKLARECRRNRFPVILFNRVQADPSMTAVTCDNYLGGQLVAHRFLETGRERVGIVGGTENTSTHLERVRGFLDVWTAHMTTPVARDTGGFSYSGGLAAAHRLLGMADPLDALFCVNDVMALAAIDAVRASGLRPGVDIAIIGFDDIPMADWGSHQLTTVRQPISRMVQDTVELVDALLDDPETEGTIRMAPVTLVTRGSG